MYDFNISVAGYVMRIKTTYPNVYLMCQDYLVDRLPDLHIYINEKDIAFERAEATRLGSSPTDGYLETLAVYRRISEMLLQYNVFLMHGAVVSVDEKAYMFTASSGTGKTTHVNKWIERIDNAIVINGDKPLIKVTDNSVIVCGTPWSGKEQLQTNKMVPLDSIVLMQRGEDNQIVEITYNQAFVFLLQQTYRPKDPLKMKKTLDLLCALNGRVRFFRFTFNNYKETSFDIAYQALVKGGRGQVPMQSTHHQLNHFRSSL